MNPPRVSVVVPNYNYGAYLGRRIDSILAQTISDIEVILIDDASTDDSRDVMTPFLDDPRVRLIINHVNHGGPFHSWNIGVNEATADYVWIAEADDLSHHSFLERMLRILDYHPTVGIVYCQSAIIDDEGQVTGSLAQWMATFDNDRWRTSFVENGRYECRTMLCRFCEIPNVSSAVFRRDAYVMSGGADETLRLTGDWKLYLNLLQHWDIAFVAEELNYFRHHSGSARSVTAASGLDLVEKYTLAAKTFPVLGLSLPHNSLTQMGLFDEWLTCASNLWSEDQKGLHLRVFDLAQSADPTISLRTLGRVFSTCGFAALQAEDRRTACFWFINAARLDWRVLLNRGVLSVIFRLALKVVFSRSVDHTSS